MAELGTKGKVGIVGSTHIIGNGAATGAEFPSFQDLNEAVEKYSKENNVLYVVGDCRTVNTANERLRRLSKTKLIPLFNDKFKYCGLVGKSWAMIFAGAGYDVVVYDIIPSQVSDALASIQSQLADLSKSGMLRGTLSPEEQFSHIKGCSNLQEAVTDAIYVQECVPEKCDLKAKVFKDVEQFVNDDAILASSTSCITPSEFTEELKRRSQCIVAHPVNPPYYAPLVEVVPSPWTNPSVVERTRKLLEEVGQVPVCMKKELPGFVLNRVQYAIINECWRLVTSGVISAEDIDKVMWAGLGMRYAFMGPLEVMHLNAEGMENYMERYGPTIEHVSSTFGPNPSFSGAGLREVVQQLNSRVPLDQLQERRKWRDNRLAALAKLKQEQDKLD